jgi:hypothetical protein
MKFDLTFGGKEGSNGQRGYYALRGKCYTSALECRAIELGLGDVRERGMWRRESAGSAGWRTGVLSNHRRLTSLASSERQEQASFVGILLSTSLTAAILLLRLPRAESCVAAEKHVLRESSIAVRVMQLIRSGLALVTR